MNLVCYNFGKSAIYENKNYSSYINLPQSFLSTIMTDYGSEELEFPLTFEVRNIDTNISTYCTVYEFHQEYICYLPMWMMIKLGCNDGDRLFVKLANIKFEKGTRITIRPQCKTFFDLPNIKDSLENSVINYSILTKGDLISLNIVSGESSSKEYLVEIIDTHPSETINIIDCDLEIDFNYNFESNQVSDSKNEYRENVSNNTINTINVNKSEQPESSNSFGSAPSGKKINKNYEKNGSGIEQDKSKFVPFSGQGYTLGKK
jgi:ubiquitin fusion degradation protein 1